MKIGYAKRKGLLHGFNFPFFIFVGATMVYWTCRFKLPTKNASRFLIAAKRTIKEQSHFEWTIHNDVGKRITKIVLYPPTFGYRIDLNTPWEAHRKAEKLFHEIISKTEKALLELAEKHGALVEVFNGERSEKYVQPKQIREAEKVEEKAVSIVASALKTVKPQIEKYSEILSMDGIIADAKKNI